MEVVPTGPASFDVPEEAKNIDMDLYSRQYYVYGGKAMTKMADSNVFLSGLGGLGVEIAKNIALAGVKALTLHDTHVATTFDQASQFFVSDSSLGKNRAELSAPHVIELNPYVKISTSTANLEEEDLAFFDQFKCVILTETPLHLQKKINAYCHARGIAFISADVRGVFCWAFCDFGDKFEVHDINGEEPLEIMIEHVSKANPGVVRTLDKSKHGLEDGMLVQFKEVKGMSELNEGKVFEVKTINPYEFSIGDTSSFGDYVSGGIATEVKKTVEMSFLPLAEAIEKPDIVIADWAKMENPTQLHLGAQALDAFAEKNKRLPVPWNKEDAAALVALAKELNEQKSDKITVDEKLLEKLAFTSQGSLVGITAFLGGVVAQEGIKSITGKFAPLHQWLYMDVLEVLPGEDVDAAQCQPEGNRYDAQVVCLGKDVNAQLQQLRIFMIGAGAIGCEMLKNFAMLGVGGGDGLITVTDNDLIEKSNLNRQFLFRPKDIQKPKSTSAANAAIAMNPSLKVDAHLNKVGQESENLYTDGFFKTLDIVVNALDNVQARLYVDGRCVTNQRPLLESGTLSTKGHVQVIVPFLTESYGSRRDPPEKDVPFCTLKSFPNQIQHTIQWARDKFANLFSLKPQELNKLLAESDVIEELRTQPGNKLKNAQHALKMLESRPNSFEECIAYGRLKFDKYFRNKILQLLHNFPLDMTTKEGTPFWSGAKRPPTPVQFDPKNSLHLDYVRYSACLWAKVWGVVPTHHDPRNEADNDYLRKICEEVPVPAFQPKQNKVIETDENAKKEDIEAKIQQAAEFDEAAFNAAIDRIKELLVHKEKYQMSPEEFEKDNDANFHIDFITATSNLRAYNYAIAPADRLKTKRIAGRIMPAIATTTAAVSGLVSIELIKIVKKVKMEDYKNAFMNLGLPMFQFAEPSPAETTKITDSVSVTIWDQWDLKMGDITLSDFCNHFKKKYGLTVTGVFQGVQMVYVPLMPGHDSRLPKKLRRLIAREKGQKYVDLIVTFENDDGSDVNGPPVRYWLTSKRKKVVKKSPQTPESS